MPKFIKYFLYSTVVIIFFIFIIGFYIFNNTEIESEIPPRPESIPKSSLWVGGPDGGVYVVLDKKNNENGAVYNAKIFHSEGSISYIGKLIINTSKNPSFDFNDTSFYTGWDGDTLYLKDGRSLSIYK
ncbi:hypothetical protein [Colwellia sp. E2M01]|uniref:hypothetical protein n=1 Tax=Colwellia sp. E2M01 TaxID=2841561 RepID=UPI001C0936EF|nr:hypothetical protein [Colwellia sp. E2M01]MBU2869699.1 hypothetical protein [Colwellia sp. E2M01]